MAPPAATTPSTPTTAPVSATPVNTPVAEPATPKAKVAPAMAVPNIKDLLNPAKKEETSITVSGELLNEAYTEEALLAKWQEFAEQLRNSGKQSEYLVLHRSWQREAHEIKLVLDNHLQEDMLNHMKPDLLEHLRRALRNQHIQISATVQELDGTRKIYTTQDKLNHLAEKHPVIHDLRKRFGLDTEY